MNYRALDIILDLRGRVEFNNVLGSRIDKDEEFATWLSDLFEKGYDVYYVYNRMKVYEVRRIRVETANTKRGKGKIAYE